MHSVSACPASARRRRTHPRRLLGAVAAPPPSAASGGAAWRPPATSEALDGKTFVSTGIDRGHPRRGKAGHPRVRATSIIGGPGCNQANGAYEIVDGVAEAGPAGHDRDGVRGAADGPGHADHVLPRRLDRDPGRRPPSRSPRATSRSPSWTSRSRAGRDARRPALGRDEDDPDRQHRLDGPGRGRTDGPRPSVPAHGRGRGGLQLRERRLTRSTATRSRSARSRSR